MNFDLLTLKKQQLDKYKPLPPELVKNLDEWFKIDLTYNSNAIEGNTLSSLETALVVEKGITAEGKTINEHLEAINHAEAFDYMKELAHIKRKDIKMRHILELQQLILNKIDNTNAGRLRNIPVRISGSNIVLPNPLKLPDLMEDFMKWLNSDLSDIHPVQIAAEAHYKLVSIHPFVDGNGRTARLLMNLLLLQEGYPYTVILFEDRTEYIKSLENAQLNVFFDDFYKVIIDAVNRSLDIYLDSVNQTINSNY